MLHPPPMNSSLEMIIQISEREVSSVLSPSLSQELFDELFLLVPLLPPPPPEEGGLHVDEPPLPVLRQGGDDAVQDVLHSCPLDLIPN